MYVKKTLKGVEFVPSPRTPGGKRYIWPGLALAATKDAAAGGANGLLSTILCLIMGQNGPESASFSRTFFDASGRIGGRWGFAHFVKGSAGKLFSMLAELAQPDHATTMKAAASAYSKMKTSPENNASPWSLDLAHAWHSVAWSRDGVATQISHWSARYLEPALLAFKTMGGASLWELLACCRASNSINVVAAATKAKKLFAKEKGVYDYDSSGNSFDEVSRTRAKALFDLGNQPRGEDRLRRILAYKNRRVAVGSSELAQLKDAGLAGGRDLYLTRYWPSSTKALVAAGMHPAVLTGSTEGNTSPAEEDLYERFMTQVRPLASLLSADEAWDLASVATNEGPRLMWRAVSEQFSPSDDPEVQASEASIMAASKPAADQDVSQLLGTGMSHEAWALSMRLAAPSEGFHLTAAGMADGTRVAAMVAAALSADVYGIASRRTLQGAAALLIAHFNGARSLSTVARECRNSYPGLFTGGFTEGILSPVAKLEAGRVLERKLLKQLSEAAFYIAVKLSLQTAGMLLVIVDRWLDEWYEARNAPQGGTENA